VRVCEHRHFIRHDLFTSVVVDHYCLHHILHVNKCIYFSLRVYVCLSNYYLNNIYIYISKYLDHPSASTCHYAHDQSSPTFALALLWARWKTTFIHFCMLSHQTFSRSLSLCFYRSISVSHYLSLFFSVRPYLFLFFIFLSSQRGTRMPDAHVTRPRALFRKSKKSNDLKRTIKSP